tara:strand:- start:234 stop:500 length:267 start_codon:yes stop_codon:yes gene_type:complete
MKLQEIRKLVNQVIEEEVEQAREGSMLLESPQWKITDKRKVIREVKNPLSEDEDYYIPEKEPAKPKADEIQVLVEQALKEMMKRDGRS